jgi:hypothetical protein
MKKVLLVLAAFLLTCSGAYSQSNDIEDPIKEMKDYVKKIIITVAESKEKVAKASASFDVKITYPVGFPKKGGLVLTPTINGGREYEALVLGDKKTRTITMNGEMLETNDIIIGVDSTRTLDYQYGKFGYNRYELAWKDFNYNKIGFNVVAKFDKESEFIGKFKKSSDGKSFKFVPIED